jgi:hypothetical protein
MRRIATLGVLIVALVMTASMAISTPARSDVRATAGNSRHGVEHITRDQSDWLGAINRYRSAASLPPVTDNSSWDAGIAAHLTYLEKTPSSYLTGAYQSAHTENLASPYYTVEGATEGASSDLYLGVTNWSPVQLIDGWLSSPFHAIGMLRATLGQVAFVSQGGDAGLDVLSGRGENPTASSPILFPGPGMTTDLTEFSGTEVPTPLTTCGWTGSPPVGLPLIALLTQAPSAGLTAQLVSSDGTTETSQNGELCIVDENDYVTSDPVYGPTGAEILAGDNAVFLIPKLPLVTGSYTATISQTGTPDIAWSFNVFEPVITTVTLPSTTENAASYYATLTATGGQAPYTWTLNSGALPPGLTLLPSGTITGKPATMGYSGTWGFSVMATDSLGNETSPENLDLSVALPKTTPPPADDTPTIAIRSSSLTLTGSSIPIRLSCTRNVCRGSLTLRRPLTVRNGISVLGSATFSISKGTSATVVIHLNRVGRREFTNVTKSPMATVLIVNVTGAKQIAKRLLLN